MGGPSTTGLRSRRCARTSKLFLMSLALRQNQSDKAEPPDTARQCIAISHVPRCIATTVSTMAGGTRVGRTLKHRSGEPRVLVQGNVTPGARRRMEQLADACGASQALLLELMIQQQEVDPATGRPLWWDTALADLDRRHQEELPLTG